MSETSERFQEAAETGFEDLGLDQSLITALQRLRLDAPTDIQRRLIPAILDGKDCLARVSSGAGKTNAYLLPILQRVVSGEGLQAVVVQPTRSLALQFERNLRRYGAERPVRTAVAVGGSRARNRPDPLASDPDVLIATPRGAAELVRQGGQDWSTAGIVVVDEVDAILDDRGPDQLKQIHEAFGHEHQTILIAGELSEPVRALAEEMLSDPLETDIGPLASRAASALQSYFVVEAQGKFDALLAYCKQEQPRLAIVFAKDERQGRDLARRLERARISCRWIDARRPSARREQRDRSSRQPRCEIIVASDPAPRKLSTIPASHLLHYELPDDADVYMSRLEQVVRLRRHGVVIALVEPVQQSLLEGIERRVGKKLTKVDAPRSTRQPSRRQETSKPADAASARPASRNEVQGRFGNVLQRDEELEARGVRPMRRTLGSRFRSTRRGKPLRRPGPPG